MTKLNTKPNVDGPDDFYAGLVAAHDGLSKSASDALNARLVLVLANHIGDRAILDQAIALSKSAG